MILLKLRPIKFTLLIIMIVILPAIGLAGCLPPAETTLGEEEKPDEDKLQKAVAGAPEHLEDVVLLELLQDDESAAATAELSRLADGENAVGYKASLELAKRGGDREQTADYYYRRALELYPTYRVRFELAAWLENHGQPREAITEYLKLVPDPLVMERLAALGAGVTYVARALLEEGHWQQAVSYLEEKLDDDTLHADVRLDLTGMLGESLARQEAYGEALPHLETAYRGGFTEYAWWYARALEAAGDTAAAASVYRELGAAGAYRLGLILRDRGQTEEAARTLAQSDNDAARWQSARLFEELGSPGDAVDVYCELARGESRYKDDAAYRAYILMERHSPDSTAEMEEMLEILRDYPVWSMRLTGEAHFAENPDPPYGTPQFIKVAEALQQSGRQKLAEIEMAIGQDRAELPEMLGIGDWYLEQDNYFRATRWGIRALNTEKTRRGYELAYQRPYDALVHAAAQEYDLDPHLIWAVMREESHFRPEVDSWVGARGLMQIMPATGQEIADRKGMEITSADLLDPELNIDFGAFYLRQMLNMFDGDVDKALAAYNGGAGNVRRWSRSSLGTTPADFPTVITFLETREYIAKVLNTYHTYNWLYGSAEQ